MFVNSISSMRGAIFIKDLTADSLKGSTGAASTVPGPKGPTGADSTVPGPKDLTGADSTVPGPKDLLVLLLLFQVLGVQQD